jgi:hypothetical protein
MIRIDPAFHLDIVSEIIQNKYITVFVFVMILGQIFPFFQIILSLLIKLFIWVFPVYLMFTLFINDKKGWALGLLIWMGISVVPMQIGTEISHLEYLFSILPVLFLVIYCYILNYKLRDWGYSADSGSSPLWF